MKKILALTLSFLISGLSLDLGASTLIQNTPSEDVNLWLAVQFDAWDAARDKKEGEPVQINPTSPTLPL